MSMLLKIEFCQNGFIWQFGGHFAQTKGIPNVIGLYLRLWNINSSIELLPQYNLIYLVKLINWLIFYWYHFI